jgi:hypothetical protein
VRIYLSERSEHGREVAGDDRGEASPEIEAAVELAEAMPPPSPATCSTHVRDTAKHLAVEQRRQELVEEWG